MRWTKHGALINGTQLLIAFDNVSDCSATAFKNKTFLRCAVEAPSLLDDQHARVSEASTSSVVGVAVICILTVCWPRDGPDN